MGRLGAPNREQQKEKRWKSGGESPEEGEERGDIAGEMGS